MTVTMLIVAAAGLNACRGGNGEKLGERIVPIGQPAPKGGGYYMVGKPYKVAGRWYTPREVSRYDQVGTASWYGELFHGRRTANGEIYDVARLSAAHRTLPLPSYVKVTNLDNGRSLVVRVNDRGPFANDRLIDVSERAARMLDFHRQGTTRVEVAYLGRAPLNGDDSYEWRYAANHGFRVYAQNGGKAPKADAVQTASLANAQPMSLGQPADYVSHPLRRPEPPARLARLEPQAGSGPASPVHPPTAIRIDRADPGSTGSLPAAGYGIQAGSFRSPANAQRAQSALAGFGHVEVAPMEVSGATYYRVRVGPFASEASAKAALPEIAQAGYGGARLVSLDGGR